MVNSILAWQDANQGTNEDAARYFLKNNPDVWTPWVSPEAATKVKAAL
jgi:glycine betaine/proline transport system substrate-binding protein